MRKDTYGPDGPLLNKSLTAEQAMHQLITLGEVA